jgi:membrane-associated phospholipid phosphatase
MQLFGVLWRPLPNTSKANQHRRNEPELENRMNSPRLLQIVLVIGAFAGVAAASDELFNLGQPATDQTTFSATNSPRTEAPADDQGNQAPTLDRRDRIFYPGDTEHPKPLLRKLFLNIALDQKDIFTSPFHANRRNALEWLIPMGITGALIASDTHIADAFENSRGQLRWGGRISNIGASYTLIPIVAGSYVYGAWRDNAKGREIGVLGTESLLDSLIVVGVLKEVFRRNRPDERNPGDFWGGGTSFPSGHAIQIWSIASLLDHEYKHKRIVGITAYSLAGIVSAARIAAQKHFASDVVTGGTMGWFIGRYVYDTHMSHLSHKHSSLIPMIVPRVDPVQRSFAFALVFHPNER